MSAARQWRFVRVPEHGTCVRVVLDIEATTKAATGITRLDGVPAGAEQALLEVIPCRFLGKIATWSCEIRSGERVSCGNGATTNVVVRVSARRFFGMFVLSYHYGLGVVNSRNGYDHALEAQKGGFCNACRRLGRPSVWSVVFFGWLRGRARGWRGACCVFGGDS